MAYEFGPAMVRWQDDYVSSSYNLSAFSSFKRIATKCPWMVGPYLTSQLPLLYTEDHDLELPVGAERLPGPGASRRCSKEDAGCARCAGRQGGFRFCWVGPWTCDRVRTGRTPAPPHVSERRWLLCSQGGHCNSCLLMRRLESRSAVPDREDAADDVANLCPEAFVNEAQWEYMVGSEQ
jgi:hypothetical protein